MQIAVAAMQAERVLRPEHDRPRGPRADDVFPKQLRLLVLFDQGHEPVAVLKEDAAAGIDRRGVAERSRQLFGQWVFRKRPDQLLRAQASWAAGPAWAERLPDDEARTRRAVPLLRRCGAAGRRWSGETRIRRRWVAAAARQLTKAAARPAAGPGGGRWAARLGRLLGAAALRRCSGPRGRLRRTLPGLWRLRRLGCGGVQVADASPRPAAREMPFVQARAVRLAAGVGDRGAGRRLPLGLAAVAAAPMRRSARARWRIGCGQRAGNRGVNCRDGQCPADRGGGAGIPGCAGERRRRALLLRPLSGGRLLHATLPARRLRLGTDCGNDCGGIAG